MFYKDSFNILQRKNQFNSTFAAWDNLEKLFTSQVRARIRQYRIQLQFTKKDTLSMTKYLVKKQGFVDKMAASSHLVPHEKQIEHILNGLSPEYESFVTSISTRPGGIGELDIEELRSLLLIQENHLDIRNGGQKNFVRQFKMAIKKYTKALSINITIHQ